MKAAYINELGPPEKIIFGDIPEPVIDASRALVKVVAVTVDPIDTYIRRGTFPMNLSFPFIIGRDMAGIVEVVGSDVRDFRRVIASGATTRATTAAKVHLPNTWPSTKGSSTRCQMARTKKRRWPWCTPRPRRRSGCCAKRSYVLANQSS